ncbi:peptidoglycan DD-metalloendopeptidase family protein, partial [Streptomyces sp. NPDC058698]
MLPGLHRRTTHAVLTAATALLTALVTTSPAAAAPAGATGFAGACPAAGFVSQHYHSGHDGVDIAGPYGTPIHAVGPGEVIASGPAQGYGQWIRILHPDGTVTEYGHMYQRDVFVGDRVEAGQRIALMGSEGQSSGPHLHLRVRIGTAQTPGINPVPYLAERGITLPCTPGPTPPRPAPLVYPAESGRVVSARSADGRLEVFAAGAGGVWHAWQTSVNGGWSAWEAVSGPAGAELAIGKNADGRLEVFAINGEVLQHRYQRSASGGWSGWEAFGSGGRDVAVGSNADG